MKTLSILSYIVGGIMLILSCFITTSSAMWWVGSISVLFLIAGCIFQYNDNKRNGVYHNHRF